MSSAVVPVLRVIIRCLNILIIKLGALGDVVMATPLIAAIQRAHPKHKVHLLTSKPYLSIFANWPSLDVTVRPRQGILNFSRALEWVRHLQCTRIYDLQGSHRSAFLCALSGSPMRIGNHTHFPYTHHPVSRWTGQCHIFERMIEILDAANVGGVDGLPHIPIVDVDRENVAAWSDAHDLHDRGYVVLHANVSSARPEKRWPYFEALGKRISAHGLVPVWVGGPGDATENRRLCAIAGGLDATAAFTLPALVQFARHARFAVTNDSGPMHVLAAAKIPVFGLFGPSDWRRNHALGQRENVIACVECVEEFRGQLIAECLDQISCDIVWTRLRASGVL